MDNNIVADEGGDNGEGDNNGGENDDNGGGDNTIEMVSTQ